MRRRPRARPPPRRPRWPWLASGAVHAAALASSAFAPEPDPKRAPAVLEVRLDAAAPPSSGEVLGDEVLIEADPVETRESFEPALPIEAPTLPEDVPPEDVPALEAPPSHDLGVGLERSPSAGRVAVRSSAPRAVRPAPPARPPSRSTASAGAPQVEGASPSSSNRPPDYPAASRARGEQGVVLLLLDLDAGGAVVRAEVVGSSGFPLLDAAALDAARSWRFRPATVDGSPVATWVRQRVRFALAGPGPASLVPRH